jgi:signal transduction histidine kinase/CheY-like chemotaxis protein
MSEPRPLAIESRVLILAPTGRDAVLACEILGKVDIGCERCASVEVLCEAAEEAAGCLLVAEEAMTPDARLALAGLLGRQPAWSDLPVLILTRQGAGSSVVLGAVEQLGNVTLLERPVRVAALQSAVRVALRARQRQYQTRAHLRAEARAKQQLQDADRRKDEFLAMLAHELRNPLAPVRNSLQILRLADVHDPTVERVRLVMERQIGHLIRLVDDLMEVSRITRGKIELRPERMDLLRAIRSAVETSQPLIDAAGHDFELDLPGEPLPLDADPVRLAQVFANLLNNAAKYSDPSGRIRLGARREGEEVVVVVRDEGIGIPPELLPHVFDLFTQLDSTHRRSQGGLGIGLTLVRSLVRMHGGSVAARSEGVGHGSEFEVRLPIARGEVTAEQAPEAAPVAASAMRVLVVDDNRDAADSLGVLLDSFGYQVEVTHDGPAALRAAELFRPELVLLDIGMPEMDGYEVARRLRSGPRGDALVLVALTGWGQEEDRQRTQAAGFDHHLVKPTDLDALQRLLAELSERATVPMAGED